MVMELGDRLIEAVVAILLARYLGPNGFGLLAFALSFAWLFGMIPGFGMGVFAIRNTSRQPEEISRYLANGLAGKLLLAAITAALMAGVVLLLHYPWLKCKLLVLSGTLMILETNMRFVLSFFQASLRPGYVAGVNLGVRVGWLVTSLAVMFFGGGVTALLGVRVIVVGLGFALALLLVHVKLQKIRWQFDPRFVVTMLKSSFPFALFRLYGKVYTDIDTVMLSSMAGDVMTGWYAASHKVLRIFNFVPRSFFGAFLPAVSKLAHATPQDLKRMIERAIKYLAMIGLPITGGLCMIAEPLILKFYGPDYREAVGTLRIMAWSLAFGFLNNGMTAAIAALNKEKKASLYLVLGAVFSGASNLIVVPLMGHYGAALTTVLTEGLVLALQIRLVLGSIPDLNLQNALAKPALAAAVMMGLIFLVREAGLAVMVAVGAVSYGTCLLMLGALGKEEWKLAGDIVRMKTKAQAGRA
jgi:O-antigen/teichoic acid export membrane protein